MTCSSSTTKIARIATIAIVFCLIAVAVVSYPSFAFVVGDALAGTGLLAYLVIMFSPLLLILILSLSLHWVERHQRFYFPMAFVLTIFSGALLAITYRFWGA
jgi:hypothetical protein